MTNAPNMLLTVRAPWLWGIGLSAKITLDQLSHARWKDREETTGQRDNERQTDRQIDRGIYRIDR